MCYTLYMPIVCTLQMVSRVVITCLFAIEDLIRLCIHTVHSYMSIVLQFCSLLPMCFAFCCIKQCYTSSICSAGCTPKFSSAVCGYGSIISIIVILIIVVFYSTDWIENFFIDVGLHPCKLFRKLKQNACQFIDGVEMNHTYTDNNNLYIPQGNRTISKRTMKIYFDKYREIQSEDYEYFNDTTSSSIQELVNDIKSLSKISDKKSKRLVAKQTQATTATSREKSTVTSMLPEIMNYSIYFEDYPKSALIEKLKRYISLERALKKELSFNGSYEDIKQLAKH